MLPEIITGACRAVFAITAVFYIGIVLSTLRANYHLKAVQMVDSRIYTIFVNAIIFTVSVVAPLTFAFLFGHFFWFLNDFKASDSTLLVGALFFTCMGWLFHSLRKDIVWQLVHEKPEVIIQKRRNW